MKYRMGEIVSDVKVCLDQNSSSESLLREEDRETLELEEIIATKVEDAVVRVHMTAPVQMLETGHNLEDTVYWEEGECGWLLLPRDFMRLMVFEMSDWERAVYSAISTEDAEYAKQRSRFRGLRGTPQRPVCAIGMRPELGGRILEFYSCRSRDAYVRKGVYMPWPETDKEGRIEISERCYRDVVYMTAALVLRTLGDNDKAAAMEGCISYRVDS